MSDHLPFGAETLIIPFTIVRPPRPKPPEPEPPPPRD